MKTLLLILALSLPIHSMAQSPTGPIQIVKDHKTVNVNLDTVTPGNTIPMPVSLAAGLSAITANQGTANTAANAWPIKISDGTDTADVTASSALKVDGSASIQPASQSGTWTTGRTWSLLNSTDSVNAVQSGTWTIAGISGSISLPTGAATESTLSSLNGKVTAVNTGAVVISSSALPSGASTAAKQPALGTAGTASADVITVQGIASMTALKVDGSGVTQPVSAASLPLPSGAATSAAQSTGNTSLSSIDGKLPSTLGQKTSANSLAVTIASDQSIVGTKAPVNTTGSGAAASATVSTVITLTAPSNAVGFILQNLDTSTANLRWAIGRTATTALGQQLQPGRDSGFVPCGANVSLVAESGTQNYDIQWVSQ